MKSIIIFFAYCISWNIFAAESTYNFKDKEIVIKCLNNSADGCLNGKHGNDVNLDPDLNHAGTRWKMVQNGIGSNDCSF